MPPPDIRTILADLHPHVDRLLDPMERPAFEMVFGWKRSGIYRPASKSAAKDLVDVARPKDFRGVWSLRKFEESLVTRVRSQLPQELGPVRTAMGLPGISTEDFADLVCDGFQAEVLPMDKLPSFLIKILDVRVSATSNEYGKRSLRRQAVSEFEEAAPSTKGDLFEFILDSVEFPDTVSDAREASGFDGSVPRRAGANRSGFPSEKMGMSIPCDSEWERVVYEALESSPSVLRFMGQPVRVPVLESSRRSASHYPDVFVVLRDGRGFLLEVKPLRDMLLAKAVSNSTAARAFAHARGLGYAMIDVRSRVSLRSLGAMVVPEAIRESFRNLVAGRNAIDDRTWFVFRTNQLIRDRHVAALMYQEGVCLLGNQPAFLRRP